MLPAPGFQEQKTAPKGRWIEVALDQAVTLAASSVKSSIWSKFMYL